MRGPDDRGFCTPKDGRSSPSRCATLIVARESHGYNPVRPVFWVTWGDSCRTLSVRYQKFIAIAPWGWQPRRDHAYPAQVADPPARQALPLGLRVGAALVAVQAAALVTLAIVELGSLDDDRLGLGLTTTAFFVLYAVALGWCAYGLWHAKRWSRSPVVLTELIGLGVAWSFATGPSARLAAVLALLSIATLVCVFLPASTAALTSPPR